MKKIIFKPIFNIGAKGEKGDHGVNYKVPADSILAYDGDDVPEGYIEVADPTGGGGIVEPAIELLCSGYGQNGGYSDTDGVKANYTLTYGDNYNDYLEYDNRISVGTREFTVKQAFKALIIPYTYNYDRAASTYSEGSFYINDQLIKSWEVDYTGARYYRGKPIITDLNAGDTMFGFYPSTYGYPKQYIKIYKISDNTVKSALENIFTFYNDYCNVEGRKAEE